MTGPNKSAFTGVTMEHEKIKVADKEGVRQPKPL